MKSFAMFAFLVLFPSHGLQAASSAQTPSNPCMAPEQKQFDFWVGE